MVLEDTQQIWTAPSRVFTYSSRESQLAHQANRKQCNRLMAPGRLPRKKAATQLFKSFHECDTCPTLSARIGKYLPAEEFRVSAAGNAMAHDHAEYAAHDDV